MINILFIHINLYILLLLIYDKHGKKGFFISNKKSFIRIERKTFIGLREISQDIF